MRLAWLVPAGLGAAGLLVGAVAAVRRGSPLGATTRKGPRTGAIEVDENLVADRVDKLLTRFETCPSEIEGERFLQPPNKDGAAPPIETTDITGEPRKVRILLRPQSAAKWIAGGGYAGGNFSPGRSQFDIVLTPNPSYCATEAFWRQHLQRILTHEIAHTREAGAAWRSAKVEPERGSTAYYNSPSETAAQLTEVERDLRRRLRYSPNLRLHNLSPDLFLRESSPRFVDLDQHLTTKNRRRYQRLAARVLDEEQARRTQSRRRWGGSSDPDGDFRRGLIDEYRKKYGR
jgi:hypothetical protein